MNLIVNPVEKTQGLKGDFRVVNKTAGFHALWERFERGVNSEIYRQFSRCYGIRPTDRAGVYQDGVV